MASVEEVKKSAHQVLLRLKLMNKENCKQANDVRSLLHLFENEDFQRIYSAYLHIENDQALNEDSSASQDDLRKFIEEASYNRPLNYVTLSKNGTNNFGFTLDAIDDDEMGRQMVYVSKLSNDNLSATADGIEVGDQLLVLATNPITSLSSAESLIAKHNRAECVFAKDFLPESMQASDEWTERLRVEVYKREGFGFGLLANENGNLLVESVLENGASSGILFPKDRILQINDSRVTTGSEAVALLQDASVARIDLLRSLHPDDIANRWSVRFPPHTNTTIISCPVEREPGSGLGVSLETRTGEEGFPRHFIRTIAGPVEMTGKFQSGDELLEMNGQRIYGLHHTDVIKLLGQLPSRVVVAVGRPTQKLPDLLQNPLITDERIQDVFLSRSPSFTASSPDMQRRVNHDFDSPLWSKEVQDVTVMKDPQNGLGLTLLDYLMDDDSTAIVIRSLVNGGAANKTNKIRPFDRLVAVQNKPVSSLQQAVTIVQSTPPGPVILGIRSLIRLASGWNHDEVDAVATRSSSKNLAQMADLQLEDRTVKKTSSFESVDDLHFDKQPLIKEPQSSALVLKSTIQTPNTTSTTIESEEPEVSPTPLIDFEPITQKKSRVLNASFNDGPPEDSVTEPKDSDNEDNFESEASDQVPPLMVRDALSAADLPKSLWRHCIIRNVHEGVLGMSLTRDIHGNDVVVGTVLKNGLVHSDGRLRSNDFIMAIGGRNVSEMSCSDARTALRTDFETGLVEIDYVAFEEAEHYRISNRLPDILKPVQRRSPLRSESINQTKVRMDRSGNNNQIPTEHIEFGPKREVYLERKAGESLGLSIVGHSLGIFVQDVIAGGNSASVLSPGDRILSVNNQDLAHVSQEDAVNIIRKSSNILSLVVQSASVRRVTSASESE